MQFDVSTAMLVTSALTLAVGASLAVAVSRYPDRLRQAMHIWIGGLLLQIPVFLLFGLVGALPGVPAIVLGEHAVRVRLRRDGRARCACSPAATRARSRVEIALIAALVVDADRVRLRLARCRAGVWRSARRCSRVLSLGVARSILTRDGRCARPIT